MLLVLLFGGCKEDDLYGINSDTRTFLLANKKWQTASIFVKSPQGLIIRDEYILLPDYKKDDYFIFRADSTFLLNDNTLRDPLATSEVLAGGGWILQMNEEILKLRVDYGATPIDSMKITVISADNFSVERPVIDGIQVFSFRWLP